MIEPFLGMLVTLSAFDLGQDRLPNFAAFRFLYERLLGAGVRPWLPAAFCAAAALAASSSRSPPRPAPVDQRKRRDRAGLVEPRAGVLARMGREGRPRRRRPDRRTSQITGARLTAALLFYGRRARRSSSSAANSLSVSSRAPRMAMRSPRRASASKRVADRAASGMWRGDPAGARALPRRASPSRATGRPCRPDRPGRGGTGGRRRACRRRRSAASSSPILASGP